jgi:hypothetical protein
VAWSCLRIAGLPRCGHGLELARVDQDLVDLLLQLNLAHAVTKARVVDQRAHVLLILDLVSKAPQPRCIAPAPELLRKVGGSQVDPADDCTDPFVLRGQHQQEIRFRIAGARLYGDAGIDALRFEQRPQIIRQPVTPQHLRVCVHPRIFRRIETPEVLVRVDSHGRRPA